MLDRFTTAAFEELTAHRLRLLVTLDLELHEFLTTLVDVALELTLVHLTASGEVLLLQTLTLLLDRLLFLEEFLLVLWSRCVTPELLLGTLTDVLRTALLLLVVHVRRLPDAESTLEHVTDWLRLFLLRHRTKCLLPNLTSVFVLALEVGHRLVEVRHRVVRLVRTLHLVEQFT